MEGGRGYTENEGGRRKTGRRYTEMKGGYRQAG